MFGLIANNCVGKRYINFSLTYSSILQTPALLLVMQSEVLKVQQNLVGSDPVVSEPRWEAILNFQKKI